MVRTFTGGIVGQSRAIDDVIRQIELVSATRSTVLINGETAREKELVARAIDPDEQLLEHVAMLAEASRPEVGVVCRSPNDAQPLTAPHDEALPETAPAWIMWAGAGCVFLVVRPVRLKVEV